MSTTIRLISVDMDGTFLDSNGKVSHENLEAVHKAQQAGIVFSIATGRFYENAVIGLKDLGLDCPMITLNGGKIVAAPHGHVIAKHLMPVDNAMESFRILERKKASYYIFSDACVGIRTQEDKHHSQLEFGEERMLNETGTRFIYGREACVDLIKKGIYKFYVHANGDMQAIASIRTALETESKLSVLTQSSPSNIEIMPPDVDKGTGIKELADYLGINLSQVMAIGDQENDLPMLTAVGLGVAMGNATELVKKHSDVLTLCNDEDGVAHAIYTYALGHP